MKKILFLLLVVSATLGFSSCSSDYLNTEPTNRTSAPTIFKDDKSAMVALNGIYRMMYTSGWSLSNTHQNFGNTSTMLFGDLMGEDMVQHEAGNGWFWYDYIYDVRRRYTSTGWRSYATWNYYYTLISNANYIIAQANNIQGDPKMVEYIVGQAYAIRAYSYFYLIQIFQQTYVGHQTLPGVPLYTEPTTAASIGKGRGTVEEVYTQINKDIDEAINKLKDSGIPQQNKSHIDYYVANGIKAKIALVQGNWQTASDAAAEALKKGLTLLSPAALASGMNDVNLSSVMWGAHIIADQSGIYASLFSHMDPTAGMYGASSRKCISSWLYGQISSTDARKVLWNGKITNESSSGPNVSYCQKKFMFKNVADYTGDYIFMRAEEMLLTEAEAQCRLHNYTAARNLMLQFGLTRDANYANRLSAVVDGDTQTFASTGTPTTLLDEILVQRRIEMWGEVGRIWDILRLAKGFTRNFPGTNHPTAGLLTKFAGQEATIPDFKEFILTIPQTEFDGNPNLTSADQNPM